MSSTATDNELGLRIRELRDHLLKQGFQHGRRPGELVGMADNGRELHVRTGYTHGSYRLLAFGRHRGERQAQVHIDLNRGTDPQRIVEVQRAIVEWDGVSWPPHPDMVKSSTGWNKGWPWPES